MHPYKQFIAVTLSLLLLGQSAAFALPGPQQQARPRTLAQYQQQAKKDLQKNPQIKESIKPLMVLGGISFAIIAVAAIQTFRFRKYKLDYARTLERALKTTALDKKPIAPKIQPAVVQTAPKRVELSSAEKALFDFDFNQYAKLFNPGTPVKEQMLLRQQLTQEPWLKTAPRMQQKAFFEVLDELTLAAQMGKKEVVSARIINMSKISLRQNPQLLSRMQAFFKHLGGPTNLAAFGLLLALGLSAQDAHAQKEAARIQQNFDLFLQATPEELAEMEKNEAVREVCIQGAQVLHAVSQMNEEETQALLLLLPEETTPAARQQQILHSTAR